MPRNGSGVYTLPQAAFTPNTTISSAAVNSDFSDIAAQLTNSLAADGQTTMTGGIKASSGSAATPSYTFGSDTNTGFYSAGADAIGASAGGVAVAQITSAGIANANGIPVGIPVGSVMDFAGSSAPTGWLLCYGQSLATATYPALFAAIAYTYGGSGPNFSLPDCRGRIGAGKDNMGGVAAGRLTSSYFGADATVLGNTGGDESHTLITGELASHTHTGSGTTGIESANHTHSLGENAVGIGGNAVALGSASVSVGFNQTTSSQSANHTHSYSFTSSSVGSDSAHNNVQPTIIFNKIIFAGA